MEARVFLATLCGIGLVYVVSTLYGLVWVSLVAGLALVGLLGELIVYGIEGLSARLGLSGYASSVLVNSLAVLPELFIVLAIGWKGLAEGKPELVELALLAVLVSASFNLVVLGVVGFVSGGVGLEENVLRVELPLLRVVVASLGLLVAYSMAEASFAKQSRVEPPFYMLVAQIVFWAAYIASALRRGMGGEHKHAGRFWLLALAFGIASMVFVAEGLASTVEELIHILHIEHLGEAALAVGIAGSVPEAALALVASFKGRVREAAGGLLAATTTSLLLVYPLATLLLSEAAGIDSFMAYTLAMLATLLWVAKRSLAHENMIDSSEALYITILSSAALAALALVK